MTSNTPTLDEEPETFEHMLTVVKIMFGDAREKEFDKLVLTKDAAQLAESNRLEREAFEYAKSWHDEQMQAIHSHIQTVMEEREKQLKKDLTKMAVHYTDDDLVNGLDPWAIPLVSLAKYLERGK